MGTTNTLDLNNRVGALKKVIEEKTDKLTNTDSFYGTCSTAEDVAEKAVTLVNADNFSLRAGVTVTVKFSATNKAQNPTINVNGTGAKSVWYNTEEITTGSLWTAGSVDIPTRYTYDGTYWVWMGRSLDANTIYSAMSTAELTTGTETTLRTVRADYLKTGINQLISVKVPDAPSADGTYTLGVTVADGTPVYSWVSTS